MATHFLDKIYAQEIEKIDKKIEETLGEIETSLLSRGRQHDTAREKDATQTTLELQRLMQCIEKTLDLCHTNPSSVDILFDNLQDLSKFGSLPQLSYVPECPICTKQTQSNCFPQQVHKNGASKSEIITERNPTVFMKITSEEELAIAWQSICYHIHADICKELTTKPCFLTLGDSVIKKSLWKLYLNVLRVLFTAEQVQKTHGYIRTQQLTNLPTECCFSCLCEFCIENLLDDVSFLSMGYFRPLVVTWQELQATYIAHIQTYVGEQLAQLNDAILLCNTNQQANVVSGIDFKSLHSLVDRCHLQNLAQQIDKQRDKKSRTCSYQKINFCGKRTNSISDWLLNCVLQLVEELFWLDQQLHCISCVETEDDSSYTMLKGGQSSLASNSPSPEDDDAKIGWDWRSTLASHGVLTMLQREVQNCGFQIPAMKQQPVMPATPVDIDDATMISVFSFADKMVCHLEQFLNVLSASQGSFSPFRASFSHTLHIHLAEVLDVINSIIVECSVEVLYVAINTVEYLEGRITTFGETLHKVSENGFEDLRKKILSTATEIQQLIVTHHLKWLSGCVLLDKPSCEGNPVSFTVQAWHVYMRSISWDMFSSLPTLGAQQLVAEILSFVLEQMCFQYATQTTLADIKMLLLSTYDMLFYVCRSRKELTGSRDMELCRDKRAYNIESIHSHCTVLLATLCVGSVSLEELYQVFKRGYPPRHPCSPQLTWLKPLTAPNVIIWVSFRLATALPRPNAPALVRALTTQGCTLAIMLLSRIANTQGDQSFSDALFRTFVECTHAPDCLADTLVATIESLDGWKQFERNAMLESERPWWFKSLQILLAPYVQNMIASSALTIVFLTRNKEGQKCQLEALYTPGEQEKSCSLFCLAEILSCARDLIAMFPVPIMHCLARLQFHIQSTGVEPLKECIGLQVLLSTLYDHLQSKDELQLTFGMSLDEATLSTCLNLAGLLASIMLNNLPDGVCRKHLDNVAQQVDIIAHSFNESGNNTQESKVQEEDVALAVEALMKTLHGHAAIESLHAVLINNKGWIQSSLAIAHGNPPASAEETFNPLGAYMEIQQQTQERLPNYMLDEKEILPHLADAGITETNFRKLLCNRWELKGSNPVLPEKCVRVLKTLYS
ncbi:uncharacterized protein LOC135389166 [Ornithodoros turicata]|uniref:uncharacterized protein LOC135389166 n=1 Tax=Ornithodoros turicata TaxID=34597 RepID=UPI003138B468